MHEQINPIKRQQCDDDVAKKISLISRDLRNSQAWRACDQSDKCISIKDRQCAERSKNEWVPAQSTQKVAMQKLHRRSGRAAGQAWTAGEIVKQAARPRQAERKPSRRRRQRGR